MDAGFWINKQFVSLWLGLRLCGLQKALPLFRRQIMNEDHINYIATYTREQAIEDGVLADVTEQARETGIRLPTAITNHLHETLENIPATSVGQDYRGRLHDVLWMTFLKLRSLVAKDCGLEVFPAEVDVLIDGKEQKLWIVIDGDGLTIMYPEDY